MKQVEQALAFARQGYHVFPIHEPLFKGGALTGCTCEAYRQSEECKANHPRLYLQAGERCQNPGKCPRVRWGEKSTTDEETIRKWFKWWPTSNIGIDCGKSGLLVFDVDSYKEVCGDIGDLLTDADRATITSLTGGGGEHLWYRLDGKAYGNSTVGLPAGIDIRGVGGYIVAPGSLHKSGRRYEFEDGYGMEEMEALPIPATLDAIFSASHRTIRTARGQVVVDSQSVQRSITLAERVLSLLTIDHYGQEKWGDGVKLILQTCPFNPADDPHGEDRSAFVAIAGDGALSAGCHHNRCQHVIEDSGLSGWHLLKQTAGIQPEEKQPDAFLDLLAQCRTFGKTINFAPYIKAELQSKAGYRTDSTDTKIWDALLDLAELANNFTIYASYETLRDRAGVGSKATVQAALERLMGWAIERNETAPGSAQCFTYRVDISFVLRTLNDHNYNKALFVQSTQYENRKATDPFLSGRSRTAKKQGLTERGLGETILRIMDVLDDGQGWEKKELAEETGKPAGGIGRAAKRAEELGLVYAERETTRSPKVYYLTPEAWDRVGELEPTLKTYKLRAERKARALEEEQDRVERRLDMAEQPQAVARLAQRRSNVIDQRRRVLAIIHPEWTSAEIIQWILAPKTKAKPWLEAKYREQAAAETAQNLHRTMQDLAGVSGSHAKRVASYAGYTKEDVAAIGKGRQWQR